MSRAATDIDAVIGGRVRAVRLERGLSQTDVAETLGITFQQLQKYENGRNRIAAATLIRLAESLAVPLADLMPSVAAAAKSPSLELLESHELRGLIDSFVRIRDPALRNAVIAVCDTMERLDKAAS